MPPRRSSRRPTATPSPAPAATARRGTSGPSDVVRGATPAKHSTAYGSPLASTHSRALIGGSGNLQQAISEVITTVRKDNRAARKQHRRSTESRSTTATAISRPTPLPTQEDEDGENDGPNPDTDDEDDSQARVRQRDLEKQLEDARRRHEQDKREALKRKRDDEKEDEDKAERERREREARLKREREAEAKRAEEVRKQAERDRVAKEEARRKAEQDRLDQEEARRKAEDERLAREREEEARLAHEAALRRAEQERLAREAEKEKAERERLLREAEDARWKHQQPVTPIPPGPPRIPDPPSSVKSFVEEDEIFRVAEVQKARRRPSVPPFHPPVGPESLSTALVSDPGPEPEPPSPKTTSQKRNSQGTQPGRASPSATKSRWQQALHYGTMLAKYLITAIFLLQVLRFLHIKAHPDLYGGLDRLEWDGWRSRFNPFGLPARDKFAPSVMSDEQYSDFKKFMGEQTSETAEAVQSLESLLPRMVRVQGKRGGKLIVDEEFWHALVDRMKKDESVLTLEEGNDISDTHWKALQNRFGQAGITGQQPPAGLDAAEVEKIANRTMSKYWESWLKTNQQKVASILNKDGRLHKEALDKIDNGLQDMVVSRDEFIRLVEENIAEYRKEIDSQLAMNKNTIDRLVQEAGKVKASPVPPAGMTKAELADLVDKIVAKRIGNAHLEAAANSKITAQLDLALRTQINHFGMGNGAIIDAPATSPPWVAEKPRVGSLAWIKQIREKPRVQKEPLSALQHWEDAGECFCAGVLGAKGTHIPADITIRLTQFVVPQNLVIEHIASSATRDPLSAPKDIEIWGYFDELSRQQRVLDWMAVSFPDTTDDEKLLEKNFVKLGEFVYEPATARAESAGRDMYIYRLSQELVNMQAATDKILIRAKTNHGTDHTCFYRLRMYGDVVEDLGRDYTQ